ncbi:MAG: hypothetical protein AMJ78_04535 [Omnitrophica WOR_2 bacterium SM23_29]|nr:MAG: hypothetical protein AMJ78_04535 [Omnitrophica WOR_2 bacterium SM23_29]
MDRMEEILKAYMKEKSTQKKVRRTASCPDEATLSLYLNGVLSRSEEQVIEGHIADCHFCLENLRTAYLGDELYRERNLPDSAKGLINKAKRIAKLATTNKRAKKNLYLFGTVLSFALSFLFPRYFVQFLVAALILGLKWVFESENARTLIMVLSSLRRNPKEKDEGVSDKIKHRF